MGFWNVTSLSFWLQVQPKHVKEAYRLLNKSIIRVETPDVNLEAEDELEEEEEQQGGGTLQTRTQMYSWRHKQLHMQRPHHLHLPY